jgi:hypothetical protein
VPQDSVLIVAPADDVHALTVARRVEAQGGRAVLFDSARFPSTSKLRLRLGTDIFDYALTIDSVTLTPDDLVGVWWRRPRRYIPDASIRELHVRRFVADEACHAFEGWLSALGSQVINSPVADEAATRKPYQLACAREMGLCLADTLISNNPDELPGLQDELGVPVVFKSLSGCSFQLAETRRLEIGHVRVRDSLVCAPTIFQAEVRDKVDVRVTVIDDMVFGVAMKPRIPEANLDWRLDLYAEAEPFTLAPDTGLKLRHLLRRMGLRFGAIDLVVAEGRDVFLEINPSGQWLFAEIYGEQPISESLARALLSPPVVRYGQ